MTTLLLIRHGETDWNLRGRYQGHSDVPLNANGLAQAEQVASHLRGTRVDAIYASDLVRAHNTAAVIGQVLKVAVHTDVRLREINQGVWEGMILSDIKSQYSELFEKRRKDPLSVAPPGGETVGAVQERMLSAVTDIVQEHPAGRVVVVSHGLFLALIKGLAACAPIQKVWELIPRNAVVDAVRLSEDDLGNDGQSMATPTA